MSDQEPRPATYDHVVDYPLSGPGGATWRLRVFTPPTPPPAEGFPALLLLDPNAAFGTLVEAVRRGSNRSAKTGVMPAVVVGIGHDGPELYVADRDRIYTLPRCDELLRLLLEDAVPTLVRNHSVSARAVTLIGHSLAGWFVLWAAMQRPKAFRSVTAISPSIWWDEETLHEGANALAGSETRICISVGAKEGQVLQGQAEARRQERGMVERATNLADLLKRMVGEDRVNHAVLPNEDHASVVAPALARCCLAAF